MEQAGLLASAEKADGCLLCGVRARARVHVLHRSRHKAAVIAPRWLRPDWLAGDEVQADALVDLSTKDNELSVWLIENDKSNLEHVVTALAANCNTISNLD